MAVNALDITESLIAYTVVNDKQSLISLLKRNGVDVPPNPSDAEITASVLLASGKSMNFKKELSKLLTDKAVELKDVYMSFTAQPGMSFTGIDDFSFTGADNFFNAPGVIPTPGLAAAAQKVSAQNVGGIKTTSKDKTKAGMVLSGVGKWLSENIFTKDNINAGVQIGLTSLNSRVQTRQNTIQEQTNQIIQMQDDIKVQQGKSGSKKLSTLAWVGIGVGAAALIGLVVYLTKKK